MLKQIKDDERRQMDEVKSKTLWLAENLEYEDEFDDVVLEKQVSRAAADVTLGKLIAARD